MILIITMLRFSYLGINGMKKFLFARNKGTSFGNNIHQEQCMSPNGMGGWSGLSPTQEMVDAYEMSDGTNSDCWVQYRWKPYNK